MVLLSWHINLCKHFIYNPQTTTLLSFFGLSLHQRALRVWLSEGRS